MLVLLGPGAPRSVRRGPAGEGLECVFAFPPAGTRALCSCSEPGLCPLPLASPPQRAPLLLRRSRPGEGCGCLGWDLLSCLLHLCVPAASEDGVLSVHRALTRWL